MQLTIYRRRNDGKLRMIAEMSLEELLSYASGRRYFREYFGNSTEDRINFLFTGLAFDPYRNKPLSINGVDYYPDCRWSYAYVVFDEKYRVVTVDRLVGYRRARDKVWWKAYHKDHYRRYSGRKYRSYRRRHPKTTHERRWHHAWDDEEYAPKVRASRNHLPDAWNCMYPVNREIDNWKRYRKTRWK